ncbi:MAG: peptidoglycan-binding protein, partial [Candidatus Ryanbacteria bacterium]|nr:peptidoglycan-binding protein [Candidatus Ryanbacteria bacterium]
MKKKFLVFSLVLCFAFFASVRNSQAQVACPNLDRSLQRGMDGNDVLELQQFLNTIGYNYFTPTGHFGPLTEQAVKDFQIKNGIRSRGDTDDVVVGPRTRAKIAATCDQSGIVKPPPPSQGVQVLSPNGDEEITRRDYTLVRWKMDGNDAMIRLFLINVDGHRTWVIGDVYAKGGGATGEYAWFVSGGDIDNQEPLSQHALFNAGSNPCCGDHFKIQACILAYALCDESDGKFTVKTSKAVVDVQALRDEDGDGDLTDNDNHVIDEPTGAILIGKDVNFTASSTNDHGGTVRFLDVPFGYYVLSVKSEGYQPAVEKVVKINHFNAPRDPELGGQRHRYAPIILQPDNVVYPPVTVKLPRPGEGLIFSATTTIKWRSDRQKFDIDLVSADGILSWPVARGITEKYFVWTIGHYMCASGIVCPPIPLV